MTPTATQTEITQQLLAAYRRLHALVHPERHPERVDWTATRVLWGGYPGVDDVLRDIDRLEARLMLESMK